MAKKKSNKQSQPLSPERFLKEKARKLPIYKCLISKTYNDSGLAMITIARERGNGKLCVANFKVDLWCAGVKEIFGDVNMEKERFEDFASSNDDILMECDYDFVHNLIYGAIEFAEEADIKPADNFKLWQYILAEDNDDVPLIEWEFGRNGKHVLVTEPGTRDYLLIHKLREKLGDNFEYILRSDDGEFDEDDEDMEDYEEEPEYFHYDYPEYPSNPKLFHPFIKDLLLNEEYGDRLPRKEVDKILALPPEETAQDILNLILSEIGDSYPRIQEDDTYIPDNYLLISGLLLLAILERKEAFTAAMEILRQSDAFIDSHLDIEASEYLLPALLAIRPGEKELEELKKYLNEKGHAPGALNTLSEYFSMVVEKYPDVREQMLPILYEFIGNLPDRLKENDWYNREVPAFYISALLDLGVKDKYPEIERIFATGKVDTFICGDLEDVKGEINMPFRQPEISRLASKETLMRYLTE